MSAGSERSGIRSVIMDVRDYSHEEAGVFRGAAVAGLTIALCLAAMPAFAGSVAAAPTTKASAKASSPTRKSSHRSGGSGGSVGGTSASGHVQLPKPTQQCAPTPRYAPQKGTPWAQQVLDYPSVWKFTEGAGVTVAVIDSGVDANPKFGDRVAVGNTFANAPSGPAWGDCAGHGTEVAGIIAAAPGHGNAFEGVAPQAKILSIKVTNSEDQGISSTTLASAIVEAVHAGAKVINVSIDTPGDDTALRNAVYYALDNNVVVVAAVGNDVQKPSSDGTATAQTGPFYPANYPGVLSVGAVDSHGNLASFSDIKTNVSVTAPGVGVTSTFPGTSGNAYAADEGTSFAAPFVSGLAALLLSRYPQMSAKQVVRQIEETADGSTGVGTGNGLVNPVQAVTAVVPSGPMPTASPRPGAVTVDRATPNRSEKTVALSLAGGAFGAAVLVIAAAVVIPAGRRRRWRPGA
jgi:membrane-anchored mycosin MYCP